MIIGLSGRKRSGKGLSGAALVSLGFNELAFAGALKEFIAATFGWPLDFVRSDDFKEASVINCDNYDIGATGPRVLTGRELLQRIGTEAGRKILGEDVWVRAAMAKCLTTCKTCGQEARRAIHSGTCLYANCPTGYVPNHYVFTDVRMVNELEAIKRAGGLIIRLNREDREHVHAFIGEDGVKGCRYKFGEHQEPVYNVDDPAGSQPITYETVIDYCDLPASSHPSHFSGDTHPSETTLPDESNEWVKYDHVITTNADRVALRAVEFVTERLHP